MQFTNAYDDLSDVKLGQLFRGALVLWKDALKAAPSQQGHDEVQAQLALEDVVEPAKERVVNLHQYIHLEFSTLKCLILQYSVLSDRLHGVLHSCA